LTTRVFQSGDSSPTGHISKLGSPYLRWVLVEATMKFASKDNKVDPFYQRIRKRSGARITRVAVARKMAEICYKRLMQWHRARDAAPGQANAACTAIMAGCLLPMYDFFVRQDAFVATSAT
jgi:hypothetical protein